HPGRPARRDGVAAAEHEGQCSAPGGARHQAGEPVAEVEDLLEVPRALVAHCRRLHDRRDDVARVGDPHAELLRELLFETGVADRGWAHVDPAPPGVEVARRTDHGDLAGRGLNAHGGEANGAGGERRGYTDRRPAAAAALSW